MKALLIIFLVVASLAALAVLAYVILDIVKEYRASKKHND